MEDPFASRRDFSQYARDMLNDQEKAYILLMSSFIDRKCNLRKIISTYKKGKTDEHKINRRKIRPLNEIAARTVIKTFLKNSVEMDSGNEYSIMRLDDCPLAVQETILDSCYSFKEWLIVKNYLSDEAVNEHITQLLRALVSEEKELTSTLLIFPPTLETLKPAEIRKLLEERLYAILYEKTVKHFLRNGEQQSDIRVLLEKKRTLTPPSVQFSSFFNKFFETFGISTSNLLLNTTFRFIARWIFACVTYLASYRLVSILKRLMSTINGVAIDAVPRNIYRICRRIYRNGALLVILTAILESMTNIRHPAFLLFRNICRAIALPYLISEKASEWQFMMTWYVYDKMDGVSFWIGNKTKSFWNNTRKKRESKELASGMQIFVKLLCTKRLSLKSLDELQQTIY